MGRLQPAQPKLLEFFKDFFHCLAKPTITGSLARLFHPVAMRLIVIFCVMISFLVSIACQQEGKNDYSFAHISPEEQEQIKYRIIRYVGKRPKKAKEQDKFESRFDAYYQEQAREKYRFEAYHQKSDTVFLLLSRIAPSLYQKRVAIGLKLVLQSDTIPYYEEVFRTWKMTEEQLTSKALLLFGKMCRNEDLSPYYPQYSGKEEYIEFPDERSYFDVPSRSWKLKQNESSQGS